MHDDRPPHAPSPCPASCGQQARSALLALGLSVLAWGAAAAQVAPSELAALKTRVQKTGLVRVMVTLPSGAPGTPVGSKAERLYAELGASAFPTGRWSNGLGQIGFYTDRAGLGMLAATSAALSFGPDPTDRGRGRAHDADGSLDAIDDALIANPMVAVDIVLNTAEPAYTLKKDGSTRYDGPSDEVGALVDLLLAEPFARGIQGLGRRTGASPTPVVSARVDREAFYGLRDSVHVRAMRLQGFADPRPANWPQEALHFADRHGKAEISILLRGGAPYTTGAAFMPAKAHRHQMDAHTRALADILQAAGTQMPANFDETEASLGMVTVFASPSQMKALFSQRDPRILSIDLNKAVARIP